MVRLVLLVSFLMIACGGRDPQPMKPKEGELPPLPPASGTAIGYLVDSASVLKLSGAQLDKLKELDTSLAAKNDSIETQIRTIERPDEAQAEKDKPPPRHNNAPGAQITTSPDAAKLHQARADNDAAALAKAFALFDDEQRQTATRLLSERGITAPGASKREATRTEDDGKPLPGMEP